MTTLSIHFPEQNSPGRISASTLARLSSHLGMPAEDLVQLAVAQMAATHHLVVSPAYEADDQDVTDAMYQAVVGLVDQSDMLVEKSLFDAFGGNVEDTGQ